MFGIEAGTIMDLENSSEQIEKMCVHLGMPFFAGKRGSGTEALWGWTSQDPSGGLRRPQEIKNHGFGVQGVKRVSGVMFLSSLSWPYALLLLDPHSSMAEGLFWSDPFTSQSL